jgi:hypothetical protein
MSRVANAQFPLFRHEAKAAAAGGPEATTRAAASAGSGARGQEPPVNSDALTGMVVQVPGKHPFRQGCWPSLVRRATPGGNGINELSPGYQPVIHKSCESVYLFYRIISLDDFGRQEQRDGNNVNRSYTHQWRSQ